jgi:hypothetical protein
VAEAGAGRVAEAVEGEIDDGGGEQGQGLRKDQAADDRDAERVAEFGAGAAAEHQREGAEHRREGGHHDRAEAQEGGLEDGVAGGLAFLALRVEGEVDDHDAVLLDDADQEDDADDGDDAEVAAGEHQRQERAETGRGQGRQDRDRVDEALVEHPQHDVDGDDRGDDQQHLVGESGLEGERGALEAGDHAGRQVDLGLGGADRLDRGAEGGARRQVEGDRRGRELADMGDCQRRRLLHHLGDRR